MKLFSVQWQETGPSLQYINSITHYDYVKSITQHEARMEILAEHPTATILAVEEILDFTKDQ